MHPTNSADDQRSMTHVRRLTSVTAAAERRLLLAIAPRLPDWVTPNRLTILGIGGGALTGASFVLSGAWAPMLILAALGFVVHWFGDSLDGSLARHRRIERPRFGFFIDQAADLLTVFLILLGIGLSPWARLDVAIATYAGYLLLAVLVHMRANVERVYDIALDGIGPTEGRLIMIVATLTLLLQQPGPVSPHLPWLGSLDVLLLVMTIWAIVSFIRQVWVIGRRLSLEEPAKTDRGQSVT